MSSNNINKFHFHTSNSGPISIRNSETTVSIAKHRNNKKIRKIWGRGKRSKELLNNVCNKIGYLRSCPPRTIQQTNRLNYRRRISRIIGENDFEHSTSWKPNDLTCAVCNTPVTSKKKLAQIALQNTVLHVVCFTVSLLSSFGQLTFRLEVTSLLSRSYLSSSGASASTDLPIR